MGEKEPFDPQRAAFWLIFFVIAVDAVVVLMALGTCVYYAHTLIADVNLKCDPDGRVFQLLSAALSAALALFGLRNTK